MDNMARAVEQAGGGAEGAGLEDLTPEQRLRVEYLDKLDVRKGVGLIRLGGRWCVCPRPVPTEGRGRASSFHERNHAYLSTSIHAFIH